MSLGAQRVLVLCILVGTMMGVSVASGEVQVIRLDDDPTEDNQAEAARPANSDPKDDRYYGQIETDMQAKLDANTAGRVETFATSWDAEMKKATKEQARTAKDVEQTERTATLSATAAAEKIGGAPAKEYGIAQEQKLKAVQTELRKADRDQSKLKSEKTYVEKLDKGIAQAELEAKNNPEQGKGDAKQAKSEEESKDSATENAKHTETPFADLYKLSQKLAAPIEKASKRVSDFVDKATNAAQKTTVALKNPLQKIQNPCGINKECIQKEEQAEKDLLNIDKEFKFDNDEAAPIDESPSFASMLKADQQDEQMAEHMKDQENQYKNLKKTGKLEALPKHRAKVTDRAELAKQWARQNKKHDVEYQKLKKASAQYEARYLDGQRTDFSHDAPINFTSSPAAVALYQTLKRKHKESQENGIAKALAALKQVKYDENKEHVKMLLDARKEAPTNDTVAQLVREGAMGALQLQREVAMQAKIEAQNAVNTNSTPTTLEDELKKRKLAEVSQWQKETVLKEAEDAVVKQAEELELTGSKADLDVLNADYKRAMKEKPPLSAAEVNMTKTNVMETQMMKKDLGNGKAYKAFKKGLNASEARMAKQLKGVTAEATSTGAVDTDLDSEYSGNADELMPTSYNDPMLRPDIDYGHAFDVNSYDAEVPDDESELHPLTFPFASEDDGHVEKEADEEIAKTLGVDKLQQEFNPNELEKWESDKVQQSQDEDDDDDSDTESDDNTEEDQKQEQTSANKSPKESIRASMKGSTSPSL